MTAACTSAILVKSLITFIIDFLEDGHDLGLSVASCIIKRTFAVLVRTHFGTSFQQPTDDFQVASRGRKMEGGCVVAVPQVDIHALPKVRLGQSQLA